MEYIVKYCPKCNGELHIPGDLKSCICIYCGEVFHPQEEEYHLNLETSQNCEKDYVKALSELSELIKSEEQLMSKFKRHSYSESFAEYVQTCSKVLKPIEQYSLLSDVNKIKAINEVTEALLKEIDRTVESRAQGGLKQYQKSNAIDQYRFFFAVYLVPMITSVNLSIGEALADNVVAEWNKKNPKHAFHKAHYDDIQKGFEQKHLCFITTAVCEALDKKEDCYELNSFRRFRDEYMMQSEEGIELVKEYYQVAPVIVTLINMQLDSRSNYESLWLQYLKPCLRDIEENKLEDCRKKYIQMVLKLKNKYYSVNSPA